jgi:hypothetical protein
MRKRLIVTLMLILITLLRGTLYVLYAFFSAPRTSARNVLDNGISMLKMR